MLGGAGTMVVELSAVRLLAPWFGTSLVVWTNVIAVVLLALSLGYLAGARLSSGGGIPAKLAAALGSAGLVGAFLPALARELAPFFVPADVTLDEAVDLVLWGSLALSLALFWLPSFLLGMVSPLAAQAVQEGQGGGAGRAGGIVLAASTLGSLIGVYATSHVLLPALGLRGTFLVAGAGLGAAGMIAGCLQRGSPRIFSVLTLLGVGGAFFCGTGAPRTAGPGRLELASVESPYQSIRVVEDRNVDPVLRYLQVNEGFDSFQSVWQARIGLLPQGFYYNDFVLPVWWARRTGAWKVLLLGMGAGTAVRVVEGTLPDGVELSWLGVELDPWVLALAREHMPLAPLVEGEHGAEAIGGLDARVALRGAIGEFDQIVLDCYANQIEIPPHLATIEFFREVRARLAPGGWLSANLGGFGFDDPVVEAVAHTAAAAFEAPVLVVRVPHARNFILFARSGAPLPLDAQGELWSVGGGAQALLAPRELPGAFQLFGPGEKAAWLTDDRAPVERLQLASIREGKERLLQGGARP